MHKSLISFILLITGIVAAQAASIKVEPPTLAVAGENFAITVTITDGSVNRAPQSLNIGGCTMIAPVSQNTMQSVVINNGNMNKVQRTDYTFYFRADKGGQTTIPSMTFVVEGKTYTTKPIKFKIAGSKADAASSGAQAQTTSTPSSTSTASSASDDSGDERATTNDAFVRIALNKTDAYEQEAIECTIKLYYKANLYDFSTTKQPTFDGFLIQEVDVKNEPTRYEDINGTRFGYTLLRKYIIYPQKTGKLTINSGEYDVTVSRAERINIGGGFYMPSTTSEKCAMTSNSATVQVKPLPSPIPDGFSGAVGKFTVESKLSTADFYTGQSASVIFTVTGTGNIKYLKEPTIKFPADFETFDPKSNFDGKVVNGNMTGTNTFECSFAPKKVGDYTIPAINFIYFDPEEVKYVTLTTSPLKLTVQKGNDTDESELTSMKDILGNKTAIALGDETNCVVYTALYWVLYAIVIAAFVAIFILYRRDARLSADVQGRKYARANKMAARRLQTAQVSLEANHREQFYADLLQAVWGYLSDKLAIPASQLSRSNVEEQLSAHGASEKLTSEIIDILDKCEMARYTPDSSSEEAHQLLDKTTNAINELENIK